MPISAPGICSRRGFTLLELLVVLLIMGLFAGLVAAVSHPDERTQLRVEAERLAQLLELAAAESRLTGKPLAWTADGARYQFWRWRDDGWIEARDETLRPRQLPPGIAVADLRIEAQPQAVDMRLEFAPHATLAYDFEISLGAVRYIIDASPMGEVRIHGPR
jgi:general secretion pathway protein H